MQQCSVSIIRSMFHGSDNGLDTRHCVHFLILNHNNSHECNNLTIMFIESSVREQIRGG